MPACPELLGRLRAEREWMTAAVEELQLSRSLLDTVITAGQPTVG